ncbi:MAG: thiamine pyrophosphate-binding protein [Tepidibacter sp.]|jgi:acetolactate synthase-1/2/3 large subunit|uniref:thiamine pyrophosphate-binding protein n=1 Tax=Tepidibacter sp. TaxID=2529387 RepID=UPI0025DF4231|nr:thiamine pyrophosphate-binding protein [Tepidibacter sp.]MCT4509954.1 thiamine pyrophosphate-binding protein [Tepidibacter sp.]
MKTSEKILRYLHKNEVNAVFGLPSGTISPIVDSFNDFNEIEYIITKNEAAASYSACKYARVTQKLGVCLISGSVGVGNAINGIAEATQSKSPVLILSGYVDTSKQGLGAIQELEAEKLLGGIVKHSKKIVDEKDVISSIKEAIEIAYEHPRGAVHIGLPLDVQKKEYTGLEYKAGEIKKAYTDYDSLKKAVDIINESKSGLLIVGGGCRRLGGKVKKLAEKLNWRLVTTISAKGEIEEDFRLHMGYYGFSGTDLSDKYIKNENLECVIALGSRLGECSTQNFNKNLIKNKLIHIDIDKNVFDRAYKSDLNVEADLSEALDYITDSIDYKDLNNDITEPLNKAYKPNHTGLSLRILAEKITNTMPRNTFYVNDIGSSKIFNLNYMKIPREGDFECNVNYACMGSSIGAIGISRIDTNRVIGVFIGDGSFYMNGMSELITAKKYNMKIVFFIINNSELRFVNEGHRKIFGRSLNEFCDDYIEIANIVRGMGIKAITIRENEDIDNLKGFLSEVDGPIVVEVVTNTSETIPTNRYKSLKV